MKQKTPISDGRHTQLIRSLLNLRDKALQYEKTFTKELRKIPIPYRNSAKNLLHYLSVRQHDIRSLQEELSFLGLSSLGRLETHSLAKLEAVIDVLAHIDKQPLTKQSMRRQAPVNQIAGSRLLERNTQQLLGPSPQDRAVRIMVTMPTEAASDRKLMTQLLKSGMNIMRINCAHDEPQVWAAMIANLKNAERQVGKHCQILADLAGQKLRTGPITPKAKILKLKPKRDMYGVTMVPATVLLVSKKCPDPPPAGSDAVLEISQSLLNLAKPEDWLEFRDSRGKRRRLTVIESQKTFRLATLGKTAYIQEGVGLQLHHKGRVVADGKVEHIPAISGSLLLFPGDILVLTHGETPGQPAKRDDKGKIIQAAHISCAVDEVFDQSTSGQTVWFDDGKIGGVITSIDQRGISIKITHARKKGTKLRSNKGINLPETDLALPALSEQDLQDLKFLVPRIDMIGFSFVRKPADILKLETRLHQLGASNLGIVLKIENRKAFENLPRLLLTGLQNPPIGVMVARGDLAVEVGFDRLAEVQEEILWMCEAAHIPVIWATQVLEGLAKFREPSRAEVTDAAMSERAECVMLNKGPFIIEAVAFLDDILKRMQKHQNKKTPRLRKLSVSSVSPVAELDRNFLPHQFPFE